MAPSTDITTSSLSGGASLALAGYRRAAFARRGEVPFILIQGLGADAPPVFEILCQMARHIGSGSRRKLRLHTPCCCHLSPDEIAIIGLLAAVAEDREAEVEARLYWLVRPESHMAVRTAADIFIGILSCDGHEIASPAPPAAVPNWPTALKVCDDMELVEEEKTASAPPLNWGRLIP